MSYDNNGNMTFYSGKNFVWDANNRLTHVYSTSIPGQIARYYYSAMNNRVKKTIDTDNDGLLDTSTVYIYCGQKVCEEQNESGGFKRDYIHGGQFIDEVVMTCDSPSGLGSFSLTDLRYSVYAVVDSSGVILERYQYDPYGKRKVMNAGYGEMVESSIGQEFGYTGRRHDSEGTGFQYFRARYYSSSLGRFISRDPLGTALDVNSRNRLNRLRAGSGYRDGMSLYRAYFAVNGTDAYGLCDNGCTALCYSVHGANVQKFSDCVDECDKGQWEDDLEQIDEDCEDPCLATTGTKTCYYDSQKFSVTGAKCRGDLISCSDCESTGTEI